VQRAASVVIVNVTNIIRRQEVSLQPETLMEMESLLSFPSMIEPTISYRLLSPAPNSFYIVIVAVTLADGRTPCISLETITPCSIAEVQEGTL